MTVRLLQWHPNPAQERFLRAMRPNRRHLLRAGWGTGKTTLGGFVGQRLAHLNPGIPGLVASHNHNHVSVNLVPKLIEHFKAAGTFAGKNENKRVIYLTTGATVQWGSADTPKSLDGNDVGWAIGDEIRHWPQESYTIFQSRIRRVDAAFPAEVLLTTPDMNWIYHEFAEAEDLIQVVASTYENEVNLRPGYIEDQLRRLSPGLAKQFIHAEWYGAEGNAFPEFDRAIHCQDDLCARSRDGLARCHVAVDFGGKHAAIYFQHFDWCERHGTQGCFHVVGEWMPDDLPTYLFTHQLRDNMRARRFEPLKCFPDKAGHATNAQTGVRDIELLQRYGFDCHWSTEPEIISVVGGTDKLRSLLQPAVGKPRLYIDSSLLGSERGICTALESIKTDRNQPRRYQKDKQYEHAVDTLRYGVVNIEPPVDLKARVV